MSFPWHLPSISRLRAEDLLLSCGKNGAFIIRDNESISNEHVLCLLHEGRIHHYRILKNEDNGNFFMQAVPEVSAIVFSKLEHLVTYFSQANQGLPCELREPAVEIESQEIISMTDDESDEEDDDVDETDGRLVENDYEFPPEFMTRTAEQLDQSERLDKGFHTALDLYLGDGIENDMNTAANGGAVLEGMQNVLATTSTSLIAELQLFLSRVNMLQNVFSIGGQSKLKCSLPEHSTEEKNDFKLLMDLLAESIAGANSLQTQALDALNEVTSINQEEDKQESENRSRIFEVINQGMASFKTKMYISVNYVEGNIAFLKNVNEAIEANNSLDQSKVVQLVKSKNNIKRLRLKMEQPKSAKDFEFDSGKSREVFCQLVQQMKNQHSENAKNQASIFIGTWNMGDANPPPDLKSWFKCQGIGKTMDTSLADFPHDIYALGTQNCPVGEKDWIIRIKRELKKLFPTEEFCMVSVCTLWSIKLVVFANQYLKYMISHVQQSSVKTGIANALGNKGGVGISFSLGPLSLCFVNCHLAARGTPARVLRRNQNFLDILNGLSVGQKGVFGITHQFHHVFWFGDLNYRIDLDVQEVLGAVKQQNFGKMKNRDQLKMERDKENVFLGFEEDTILFPPTYKYKRGASDYICQKTKRTGVLPNVPSWCDRVLRHSFPQTKITCTSYGCTLNVRTSDHWPVFCTFNMSLPFTVSPDQTVPKSPKSEGCEIIFHEIGAKIKTNSKTQFYVEFHSTCFEEMNKTEKNINSSKKDFGDDKHGGKYSYPEWNKSVIPHLYPIISDHNYLVEQHLLLAIKSVDNDESYGECCIALRTMITAIPQHIVGIVLSHSGEKTGEIMVTMHVKVPDNNNMKEPSQPDDSPPLPEKQGTVPAENPSAVPKRHSAALPDSTKKSKPRTVEEMMQRIGFPQYTSRLLADGFDDLAFLGDLTEAELTAVGVPEEHHRMILAAIKRYTS